MLQLFSLNQCLNYVIIGVCLVLQKYSRKVCTQFRNYFHKTQACKLPPKLLILQGLIKLECTLFFDNFAYFNIRQLTQSANIFYS